MPRKELRLPDLGLGDRPIHLGLWLRRNGDRVAADEPLVEVTAASVTVDLPSPADGVLVKKYASDGDLLTLGQCLALVEEDV